VKTPWKHTKTLSLAMIDRIARVGGIDALRAEGLPYKRENYDGLADHDVERWVRAAERRYELLLSRIEGYYPTPTAPGPLG
jgi:hypothetical protein